MLKYLLRGAEKLPRPISNNIGVSQVIGYLLSLIIVTSVITASIFTTQFYVDQNFQNAGESYAKELANRVEDLINDVYLFKQQYPSAYYSTSIEIPNKLVGRYDYYIQIDNDAIHIRSTDGQISVDKSLYGLAEKAGMDFSGKIYGSSESLKMYCEETPYIHKIDFGTHESTTSDGYIKMVPEDSYGSVSWMNWDAVGEVNYTYWAYRTIIEIQNPVKQNPLPPITNYQFLVQLNDTNFDYSKAKPNGSDIRFVVDDNSGTIMECPFWIERWNPKNTHTSRIWVKVPVELDEGDSFYLYMYHGSDSSDTYTGVNDGDETFLFFDDFNDEDGDPNTVDSDNWPTQYKTGVDDIKEIDGCLELKNEAALATSKDKISETSYIIETKAKAIGSAYKPIEASLFVRANNIVTVPYKHGTVFSSGFFNDSYLDFNLGISSWDGSSYEIYDSDGDYPAITANDWYRLRYVLNAEDDVVYRYNYEDFSVDGFASIFYESGGESGCFGPCVIDVEDTAGDLTAIYDWIYVRQFAADTDFGQGASIEDIEPTASVVQINSKNYRLKDLSKFASADRLGDELGADIIYDRVEGPGTLIFDGLTKGQKYSMTFTVGDKDNIVDNMKISVTGGESDGTLSAAQVIEDIDCSDDNYYRKIWFSGIYPYNDGASNIIKIEFLDDITENGYHWAVGGLTFSKGDKTTKLSYGD